MIFGHYEGQPVQWNEGLFSELRRGWVDINATTDPIALQIASSLPSDQISALRRRGVLLAHIAGTLGERNSQHVNEIHAAFKSSGQTALETTVNIKTRAPRAPGGETRVLYVALVTNSVTLQKVYPNQDNPSP